MKFVKEKLGRISIVLLFIVFGLVLKTAIHSPVPKHFEENVKIIDNSGADITLIETTGILSEIEEVMEQGPDTVHNYCVIDNIFVIIFTFR